MKREILILASIIIILNIVGCSSQIIKFEKENLNVINRDIVSINNSKNTLILNNKKGDGLAIIEDLDFDKGIIEIEIKGEDNPGKSFVGIAFNVQNDSTYDRFILDLLILNPPKRQEEYILYNISFIQKILGVF